MVSKVFEHPFDLTKVRLQSQVLDKKARFNGPIDCLTKTWQNEGVRGLYRGLPAPIVGAMVENASLFLTYREFQNLIQYVNHRPASEKPSLPELALAAAGAGAVTSFFLTPIELVKCKMQVQMLVNPPTHITKPHTLPGPISVLLSVIRTTGFRGLWLGHTGTFIRESGGTAAWFTTKEFVASLLVARRTPEGGPPPPSNQRVQLKAWESALSGAIAGAAFNFALFPADTVKSAMQTEAELRPTRLSPTPTAPGAKPPPPPPPPSFFRTFGAMYKAQGIRGLYAGCGITVARAIPSSGMIFLIYDGLSKRFG
ncbi:mitochondrial carrier [Pluteus cervinus]|uniref:Mitochondrial carrier n=1 Tax=Pluteus cervinus TaxID=181527 RepID=A0ACD3APM7_9AGAR|nr:mitochondrial carrier [Pluteus cervinus]